MPRRFFRKFALKRDQLLQRWYLAPFKHLLQDPRLWGISRRNAVPAVALGILIAWLPFPGHIVAATILAITIRVNIPLAILACLASNPLTAGPMFYLAFRLGAWLLGTEARDFDFDMSVEWMLDGIAYIWNPLLLGCIILGLGSATVAYVVLELLWRASVSAHVRKRSLRGQE